MASSTIRASFTCFDAAQSIGRMASSKKHNTKRYQCQRGKAKERERVGGGGEKKHGASKVVKIKESERHDGIVPLQPQQIDVKHL